MPLSDDINDNLINERKLTDNYYSGTTQNFCRPINIINDVSKNSLINIDNDDVCTFIEKVYYTDKEFIPKQVVETNGVTLIIVIQYENN